MKANTWMPLYIADYERKTNRLTLEEDGAYMRLLRDYWVNGPPPDDDAVLSLIVRVSLKDWRRLRAKLIGFFEIADGQWRQGRADEERAKADALSLARSETGRKGGRPKKQPESKDKPIGFRDGNQNDKVSETPASVAQPSPEANASNQRSEANASALSASEPKPHSKAKGLIPDGYPDAAAIAEAARQVSDAGVVVNAAEQAARFRTQAKSTKRELADWVEGWFGWIAIEIAKAPPTPTSATGIAALPTFAGPPDLRARIAADKGEGWTATWLDQCAWRDVPAKSIVAPRAFTADTLTKAIGDILTEAGVGVLVEPPTRSAA